MNNNNYQKGNYKPKQQKEVLPIIPSAIDIERAVLGAMMLDSSAYYVAMNQYALSQEDFTVSKYKKIFAAIQLISANNGKVDMLTVVDALPKVDFEKEVDIVDITDITMRVASTANLEHHTMLLAEKTMRRKMIEACDAGMKLAFDDSADVIDSVQDLQAQAFAITDTITGTEENIDSLLDEIEAIATGEKEYKREYTPTGIKSLDEGGFYGVEPRDIIAIGAESGVGKSAFMLNLVKALIYEDKRVAFFSYEMTVKDLLLRLCAIETGIDANRIKSGQLAPKEIEAFTEAMILIRSKRHLLHFFDCAGMPIEILRSKCLSIHYRTKLDCVMIDYLQIMGDAVGMRRQDESQDYNCKRIQALKKQIGCSFVIASQFRKERQKGINQRPSAADLKGAQMLEAMCTKILILDSRHKRGQEEYDDGTPTLGKVDVYVDKNREGQIFNTRLNYKGSCLTFTSESDKDEYFNNPQYPSSNNHSENYDNSELDNFSANFLDAPF